MFEINYESLVTRDMCVLGKHSGDIFSYPVGRTWQMLKTTQGHTTFFGHRCHTGHEHLVFGLQGFGLVDDV